MDMPLCGIYTPVAKPCSADIIQCSQLQHLNSLKFCSATTRCYCCCHHIVNLLQNISFYCTQTHIQLHRHTYMRAAVANVHCCRIALCCDLHRQQQQRQSKQIATTIIRVNVELWTTTAGHNAYGYSVAATSTGNGTNNMLHLL